MGGAGWGTGRGGGRGVKGCYRANRPPGHEKKSPNTDRKVKRDRA